MVEEHKTAPTKEKLQKKLAEEVTIWVHGKAEYEKALKASEILLEKYSRRFGKFDEELFYKFTDGVPTSGSS